MPRCAGGHLHSHYSAPLPVPVKRTIPAPLPLTRRRLQLFEAAASAHAKDVAELYEAVGEADSALAAQRERTL